MCWVISSRAPLKWGRFTDLCTKHINRSNIMFYERVMELVSTVNYRGNYHNKIIKPLMSEFEISERVVYRRIKSYTGKTITQLVQEIRTPDKESVDKALLKCNSMKEMRDFLKLKESDIVFNKVFEKYYGTSTFTAAKANLILKQPNKHYNPTIDDNLSLIVSQCIGDGSLDRVRKSIRIDHIDWQYDYLKMKVSLFNRAFPTCHGAENIKFRKHVQGHEYVSWYSRKLPQKYIDKVIDLKKHEMVCNLTPLGIFLLYFDDGFLTINDKFGTYRLGIAYSEHYQELGEEYLKMFKSFGFSFNKRKNAVYLSSKPIIADFIKNMILPFSNLIPNSLEYKIDMKI